MIPSKSESSDVDTSGNLSSAQLLRDIEAISKALFAHKSAQYAPVISSHVGHQFAGKVLFPNRGLVANPKNDREDMVNKLNRSSSSWNWKKPLKALSHLRDRKFSCSFFLHVHNIEALPANFNDFSLTVQFGRKNEVITTRKSQVLKGVAHFNETLMHRCNVYCHRSGPDDSCKYEPKIFLIQASVVGARGLDIGKHWFDLTRVLPLPFEELVGEKSSGKWTTSFKLAGKAKGAILNVSFGYLLTTDALLESSGNVTVSQLIDLACRSNEKQSGTRLAQFNSSGRLSRSGSVPSNLNQATVSLSQLVDGNTCHEVLIPPALELSKSIHLLYKKLDEADWNGSIGSEASTTHIGRSKQIPESDLNPDPVNATEADEDKEIEFEIIEKGVELEVPELKEATSVSQSNDSACNVSEAAMVHVDKISVGDNIAYKDKLKYSMKENMSVDHKYEAAVDDNKNEKQSKCPEELDVKELASEFRELLTSESPGLDALLGVCQDCDNCNYMEVKSSYRVNRLAKRSLSEDDVSESVASDFLDMLENDQLLSGWNSDGDPESPRERLLREFEKEALISGNFLLSLDETGEDAESSSAVPVDSHSGDDSEDHMLASLLEAAEEELDIRSHSLGHGRKDMTQEDLEVKALMREWGFDKETFQNSPRCCSNSGFGSPIELAPEEPDDGIDFLQQKI
ncbi:protein PLASTID MOVEMENT IMPAIRED 1-RELATED 2-like [Punica granatum]|uniref:Protein PLASTID MOVEMENT IMPAIRED 1-RELATED 2-like n=1 Tax=Punica granatum TaxID=22663 RepID=A0A218VS51_PUNGR|nr:protein PLASTID MOVEMENT IMPAIRED 1-RELATED 2-like [Punica granatum]OWM63357.1 hypothetical protein CDL15_Pgr022102 [Punica granatum]